MGPPSNYSTASMLWGLSWELLNAAPKVLVSSIAKLAASIGLASFTADKRCITATYLTQELRQRGLLSSSNDVASILWEGVECGTVAAVYRIKLTYTDQEAASRSGAPVTAIVKVLGSKVSDVIIGSIVSLYKQEMLCLTTFREHVGDLMPMIYACKFPWYGTGFHIMEDYGHMKHTKSRAGEGMGLETVCKMASFAGRLHARTFLDADLAEKMAPFNPWMLHSIPASLKKFEANERLGTLLVERCPRLHSVMKDIANNGPEFFANDCYRVTLFGDINKRPTFRAPYGHPDFVPFAVVHGDARLDNAFFDAKGDLRMVDWQLSMARAPVSEIVWMLVETDTQISCDRVALDTVFESYLDAFMNSCQHPLVLPGGPLHDRQALKKALFENPFQSALRHLAMIIIIAVGAVVGDSNEEVLQTIEGNMLRVEAMCNTYLPRL